ncbi:MAG: protein-L-isoaspartate(D-aspartate) O-methyltransferase [Spirochaetales bacterium]|nr:protein-L-isoaspartate(D-aspartate) O-methyltransferase [Spirochaetales bacterium]
MDSVKALAQKMVKFQLASRGIYDSKVLDAMLKVPRHLFIPGKNLSKNLADCYADTPLSIGHGQTISQPYMVAYMTELLELRGHEKILEIGTGSGYQTAVLAELCRKVITIERIKDLSGRAQKVLDDLNYKNIIFIVADGTSGYEREALYDAILVTAAAPSVPVMLKKQLADNGKLIIPVGDISTYQELYVIKREGNTFSTQKSIGCRFVPLIGKNGYKY